MEMGTLEVVRSLQSGPFAADTLARARAALAIEAADDGGYNEPVDGLDCQEWLSLIDAFADACPDTKVSASAHVLAAELRGRLGDAAGAVDSYALALDLDPHCDGAFDVLVRRLAEPADAARLGALLAARAQALRNESEPDEGRLAQTYRELARARVRAGDRDAAIAAFDRAVDHDPDVDTIEALAEQYLARARPGDEEQAADLYYAIADALQGEAAISYLERALDVMPDHAEAMERFEALVPVEQQLTRLRQRWVRYIERAGNDPDADDRRVLLSRALAAEGRYRDALLCIAPAADHGDTTAQALREAYVANLEGQVEEGQLDRAQRISLPPSRALTPRSGATKVGIDLSEHQADGRIGDEHVEALRKGLAQPVAPPPAGSAVIPPSVAPSGNLPSAGARAKTGFDRRRLALAGGAVATLLLVGALLMSTGDGPEAPTTASAAATAGAAHTAAAADSAAQAPKAAAPLASAAARPEPPERARKAAPRRRVPARADRSVRLVRQATRIRGGSLPKARVLSQLQRSEGALVHCYDRALGRDDGLRGRIIYTLSVGRDGRVTGVRQVGGSLQDKNLISCGRNALKAARFPRPKGKPAQLRVPFAFGE